MVKMSNSAKERLAVNAINMDAAKLGSRLIPEIPIGDKGTSFDGHISVYTDDSEKAESFINHVPTQVKGTEVEDFTSTIKKFPLELKHYQNYYRRGGCLLLVVEIKSNNDTKIFYKQLLPLELKNILDNRGKQVKTNVELRPLNETTLYVVCRRFIEQMEKQNKQLIEKNKYTNKDYDRVVLSSLTYNPQNEDITDIFSHDFIKFGVKDNIEYPLGNIRFEEIGVIDEDTIKVGSSIHSNFKVETKINKTDRIVIIEDCLKFNFSKKKIQFNFLLNGHRSLGTQIKIIILLIDILKIGKLETTSFTAEINISGARENREHLEYTLDSLLKLRGLFSELIINDEVILKFDNRLYSATDKLHDLLIDGNIESLESEGLDINIPIFIKYKIGDVMVLLFLNPKSDKKIINGFSEEMLSLPYKFGVKEDNSIFTISPYFMLESETIKVATNINYGTMIRSLNQIDFSKINTLFTSINGFYLKCLNLYDETGNKEFLRIALHLLENVSTNKDKLDAVTYNIFMINYTQAKLRYNKELTNHEYFEMMSIRDQSKLDNYELRFCANILLGNKTEANMLFKMLSEKQQELYKTMPIYTLYNGL